MRGRAIVRLVKSITSWLRGRIADFSGKKEYNSIRLMCIQPLHFQPG